MEWKKIILGSSFHIIFYSILTMAIFNILQIFQLEWRLIVLLVFYTIGGVPFVLLFKKLIINTIKIEHLLEIWAMSLIILIVIIVILYGVVFAPLRGDDVGGSLLSIIITFIWHTVSLISMLIGFCTVKFLKW